MLFRDTITDFRDEHSYGFRDTMGFGQLALEHRHLGGQPLDLSLQQTNSVIALRIVRHQLLDLGRFQRLQYTAGRVVQRGRHCHGGQSGPGADE